MHRTLLTVFLTASMLLAVTVARAATFPDKPPTEHFYVDGAGLITPEAGEKIDATASALLGEEKIPLYVVTIPSLSAQQAVTMTVEQYARELFDEWGIGWQDRNYGILLLISAGDRKARIELGSDWRGMHDGEAVQIMNELIIPAFRRGDYATGIADGVRGLDAMARGLALPKPSAPWWFWPVAIGALVLVVLMIINLFRSGRSGWAWALIAALGVALFFMLRNAGSGSGGGFGGGSGGGGGATGSW